MSHYPKWIYASGGRKQIVKNQADHAAAGPGWYESPADIPAVPVAAAAPAPVAPEATADPVAASPEPAPVVVPTIDSAPAPDTTPSVAPDPATVREDEAKQVYASTVSALVDTLNGASREDLERLKAIESKNPNGVRVSLMKFVDTLLAKLPKE